MPAPDRIELESIVRAPIDIVWQTLTSSEEIESWYAFDGATIDLRPGGAMTFHWDEHGTYRARIGRVEPPHLLTFCYASQEADTEPRVGNSTLVTFALMERAGSTTISLVETGYSNLHGSLEDIKGLAATGEMAWRNALDLLRGRALSVLSAS